MPRGDGTGPAGQGGKTGRGLGNCAPETETKRSFFGFGGGFGRNGGKGLRRGMGKGLGRGFGRNSENTINVTNTDK